MSDERCTIKGFNINSPFDHSLLAPDLTPIYELCHSRKSINRPLISHERGTQARRREEEVKKKIRRREGEGEIASLTTAGVLPAS
ncbi:hypothetical protein MA16_Dca005744 [Dendrobium catenatum]|uniref:Uncharacterized protein n=1 Tax=Dendrobium catenatum TaxID=906689 RepID=A0A2I0WX25_9ASPA|nr:hypothetical protein MA16_Dca005744 [Dendrobium catenatum]